MYYYFPYKKAHHDGQIAHLKKAFRAKNARPSIIIPHHTSSCFHTHYTGSFVFNTLISPSLINNLPLSSWLDEVEITYPG